ncbi:MAG: cytochrome c [Burkholderiales bacterium]
MTLRLCAALVLLGAVPATTGTAVATDAEPPGKQKAQACSVCHGPLGLSQTPDAPHLAGQPAVYLVRQLKAYRGGQRQHEVMNIIAKSLSDRDIEDLAQWYASIAVSAAPSRQDAR